MAFNPKWRASRGTGYQATSLGDEPRSSRPSTGGNPSAGARVSRVLPKKKANFAGSGGGGWGPEELHPREVAARAGESAQRRSTDANFRAETNRLAEAKSVQDEWKALTIDQRAERMGDGEYMARLEAAQAAPMQPAAEVLSFQEALDDPSAGRTIDETTDEPSWGTGYQAISKEDVLKNVAEPKVLSPEEYERLDERKRSAIDFNTLLHQSDLNGDRGALSEALGLELTDDQMISTALMRDLENNPAAQNALQGRTAAVTHATRAVGKEAASTTSGWEFDSVSEQINDMLNDRMSSSILGTQEATQGSYNLQALPQTQAFETMFNDLADADQGEWSADELVGLLEQGGYDPDSFWGWAAQRLQRHRGAGGDSPLAPVKNPLAPEEFAQRLQIDLGG